MDCPGAGQGIRARTGGDGVQRVANADYGRIGSHAQARAPHLRMGETRPTTYRSKFDGAAGLILGLIRLNCRPA